jgi:hypothetical protein
MNSNNDYQADPKKYIPCKFGCGTSIRFDPTIVSDINRKMIPLNLDNTAHNCANRAYKTKDSVRICIHCKQQITFHENRKSPNGRKIPLNLNDTVHDCILNPYNQARLGRKNN